jgi:hypothetical protein
MEIDRELVQKILDEELGGNYVIDSILDTEKYIFIDYKHKTYKDGDERGHLIGVGPVVFNKETSEYKLLGSEEYIFGDYSDYLPEVEEAETLEDFFAKPVEEIIKNIHDREFVNSDDCFYFLNLIEKEFPEFRGGISMNRTVNPYEHFLFDHENPEHRQKIIGFWELIGFPYLVRNEKEIVLGRVKNTDFNYVYHVTKP